jgi:hypothetical protein
LTGDSLVVENLNPEFPIGVVFVTMQFDLCIDDPRVAETP